MKWCWLLCTCMLYTLESLEVQLCMYTHTRVKNTAIVSDVEQPDN